VTTIDRLADDTAMGAVTLNVADLDAMTGYYRDAVGLQQLSADGPRVVLGTGTRPVVVLEHSPELRRASPGQAGLYHTAIVFDSRAALAAPSTRLLAAIRTPSPARAIIW
jgi:catechol 2,3-dioxygenase